jgi:hypothetical protein
VQTIGARFAHGEITLEQVPGHYKYLLELPF